MNQLKVLICLVGVMWGGLTVKGQSGALEKANQLYDHMAYADAIPIYEKILKKKMVPEALEKLADSYRLIRDYEQAQNWYARLVNLNDVEPMAYYHYAQMLMSNEQYVSWVSSWK